VLENPSKSARSHPHRYWFVGSRISALGMCSFLSQDAGELRSMNAIAIYQQLSAIGFELQYQTVFVAHPAD
jgi:hypothetical protein